jgi:ubiquitin-protein ligase
MIDFRCPNCSRQFSVPDHYAGREARCGCKQVMKVPAVAARASTPAGPTMRERRLIADTNSMTAMFTAGKPIRLVSTRGQPADSFVLEFDLLTRLSESESGAGPHRIEIELTADYPRVPPRCRMLTDVFHPNIDTSSICIGDHWAAGEKLTDLVIRVGEMLAYQAYNIRSPLNAEAAMWADLNPQSLPTDPRDIRSLVGG